MNKINEEMQKAKTDDKRIMLLGPGLGPVKEILEENVFLLPR